MTSGPLFVTFTEKFEVPPTSPLAGPVCVTRRFAFDSDTFTGAETLLFAATGSVALVVTEALTAPDPTPLPSSKKPATDFVCPFVNVPSEQTSVSPAASETKEQMPGLCAVARTGRATRTVNTTSEATSGPPFPTTKLAPNLCSENTATGTTPETTTDTSAVAVSAEPCGAIDRNPATHSAK